MIGYDEFQYAGLTDVGMRRSHNQDSHALLPAEDSEQWKQRGHVFLVADGMGGHAVGELASKLAADSIPHIYSKHSSEGPLGALRKAFVEANAAIHNRGQANREFAGMGTTATALILRPEGAWVGHVGDSRIYRVRAGKLEQLSFDHSRVWELARRQRKNPEELRNIPSNVILRSLGPDPQVQVDVEGPHPIRRGDIYLVCSDGLSGPVGDKEIGAVLSVLPPAEASRLLIHLANFYGGPDNITAVVVRIPGEPTQDEAGDSQEMLELFTQPRESWLTRVPWPSWSLYLGIALALGAIYLTANRYPGEIAAFLFAALCLITGLVGLMVQSVREPKQGESPATPRKVKIYRQVNCAIDRPLVDQLEQTTLELEQLAREQKISVAWDKYRTHHERALSQLRQDNLPASFREHCLALLVLMDALAHAQAREEVFKPLWDKASS